MSRIVYRPLARGDLIDIAYRYMNEASPAVGGRFRVQAEATIRRLATMPHLGSHFPEAPPALADLRYLPLPSRFKKYLVFYRPIPGGIEIVRVLHGARDLASLLSVEFAADEDEGPADDDDG